MKKRSRKRSKPRTRIVLTLAILVILGISAVGAAILFNQFSGDGNKPPNDTNPNYPVKILNKQIPPGYVMGFPVEAGWISGMNAIFIENAGQKVSIRFTAKSGGTVTNVAIDALLYKGQPTVKVGLQEDSNGSPEGQWMKENAFGIVQLGSKSGFKTVQLGTAVTLTKGKVYHVVIEAAEDPLNGTAAIASYQANGFAQPLNPDDPDIVWNDPQMNILYYCGDAWKEQNKWPIFVISYSDGTLEGQPYTLIAQWVVWGATYVGQTLIPASDYNVEKIAFDVSLGSSGAPQDRLYYQVRDSSSNILAEGVFAERSQLNTVRTWVEATLPTPVTLKAGKLYRISVLSPQTDFANAYYLFGHEFSYNASIGYGGLQYQLTSSYDGGRSWNDNADADAVFKITTPG